MRLPRLDVYLLLLMNTGKANRCPYYLNSDSSHNWRYGMDEAAVHVRCIAAAPRADTRRR
jgi:hypothetical protein